jgi:rubrerythrin
MNVFDFAVRMELDGKAFYKELARKTRHAGLRMIFRQLAADEQKHHDIFLALKVQAKPETMKDSTALEHAKNVFADLLARKEDLGTAKDDLDGYRHAMKLEVDSFELYEGAAGKEQDKDIKELLLRVAAEEHKHYEILQNIYDFANAPSQYLAWGEFSNVGEFHQFGRDVD